MFFLKETYCSEECYLEAEERSHRMLCLGNDNRNLEHPLHQLEEAWK